MAMFWDNLQSLWSKAEAKRALGTYVFGLSGLGISTGIQAAGQTARSVAETTQVSLHAGSSLVEQIFPEYFASGTMEIIGGKWFIMGMAFSDIISIVLGLLSCGAIIIRLLADLETWLYRRKMDKQLKELADKLQKKK